MSTWKSMEAFVKQKNEDSHYGATTLCTMTFSLTTLSFMIFNITTASITTLSVMTLSIKVSMRQSA
jgi:hypothetical protein